MKIMNESSPKSRVGCARCSSTTRSRSSSDRSFPGGAQCLTPPSHQADRGPAASGRAQGGVLPEGHQGDAEKRGSDMLLKVGRKPRSGRGRARADRGSQPLTARRLKALAESIMQPRAIRSSWRPRSDSPSASRASAVSASTCTGSAARWPSRSASFLRSESIEERGSQDPRGHLGQAARPGAGDPA